MGCYATCTWYEEGLCHNPDCYFSYEWEKGLLEAVEPDAWCTLWEEY